MALGYAWFDSYDSVGYVLTLHISPPDILPVQAYVWGMYGGVFLLQGGEFQRPWKRCSMIANCVLEVEIAMDTVPMPISVSSTHFALRYEVPKFLPRGGHLCMAMLTITAPSEDAERTTAANPRSTHERGIGMYL